MTRKPLTPAQKAHRAINDAFVKHGYASKDLRCDYAANVLVMDGMAEDTAADLVDRVWRNEFEIMGAV